MHNTGCSGVSVPLAAYVGRFDDMIMVTRPEEPRPEFTAPPYPYCHVNGKWILRIKHFSASFSGAITSPSIYSFTHTVLHIYIYIHVLGN